MIEQRQNKLAVFCTHMVDYRRPVIYDICQEVCVKLSNGGCKELR